MLVQLVGMRQRWCAGVAQVIVQVDQAWCDHQGGAVDDQRETGVSTVAGRTTDVPGRVQIQDGMTASDPSFEQRAEDAHSLCRVTAEAAGFRLLPTWANLDRGLTGA
jgi:hypothetical protein